MGIPRHSPELTAEDLRNYLARLHEKTSVTPLFNPVSQLGFELSKDLESDAVGFQDIETLVHDVESAAFHKRAQNLNRLLQPTGESQNIERLAALIRSHAIDDTDPEKFSAVWQQPAFGCVFTGHPTFMLSREQYHALARLAADPSDSPGQGGTPAKTQPSITIESEHSAAMDALARAHGAQEKVITQILEQARKLYPSTWHELRPNPFSLGTWIGYDMDGRTDIHWTTSVRFRLAEKQIQLTHYIAQLENIASDAAVTEEASAELQSIAQHLVKALDHTKSAYEAFGSASGSSSALSSSANALTGESSGKIVSLKDIVLVLGGLAGKCDDKIALRIITLASVMQNQGLGVATVHFRINASQLNNAIRRRLGDDASLVSGSRAALVNLRELIAGAKSVPVNFASLAVETTTAVRQFLAMAQILKHIDADNSVRLLIAECEQPDTVLAAVYFAKLFGIDNKIDISPLFETEPALEHGGRFLDALLGEPSYQAYARKRGRLAIQTGFSDAGRLVGQIPASLAIERLQGRLATLMEKHGLQDVTALVFNTHGESMGRGAHPSSVEDRLSHVMSPWAHHQFSSCGLTLKHEVSFQGGDGFLMFGTEDLALATMNRMLEAQRAICTAADVPDPFYDEVDLSLDFYRAVRETQTRICAEPSYARSLTAFGLSLLRNTGSRKSKRQTDSGADPIRGLTQIRAIPHNAALQQLGYPANVIAGVGLATESEQDRFVDLYHRSPRAQALLRMVIAAERIASIKTLLAYGELFDGGFWATRPYRGAEPGLERACKDLAEGFVDDDRAAAFKKLAILLRVDGLKLHRLLNAIGIAPGDINTEETRRTLGILHALRLALMQHIFLKAVQIPSFSKSNDVSRADILEMVFSLQIPDAVEQLRSIYPVDAPSLKDFQMDEPTGYPDDSGPEYADIHEKYIDPIEKSYAIILSIGTAIAHIFGAHG